MKIFALLHHWFVPHEGNNHRAKALHHQALLFYVLALGLINLSVRTFHSISPDVLGYATDIRIERLLEDTNAQRASAGLAPLSLNETLARAAQAKAADMFANNYWAHNSPQGKTPWDFIVGAGYRYTLAGENLAKNFDTSDNVVAAWMNSPTHKDNIVKPGYREIGFAVVNGVLNGEETTLVVQMFGTSSAPVAVPKVQAAEPESQKPATETVTQPQEEESEVISESPSPVVVTVPDSELAVSATEKEAGQGALLGGVIMTPTIDIKTVTSTLVYAVAGFLIGLLLVDGFIVRKHGVVRLAGHNIAHILFLTGMVVAGLAISRGSLL